MILTDKAKSDFLEWYGADERYFETTATKTEEYANVCEWLDTLPSSVTEILLYCVDFSIERTPFYDFKYVY